MSSINLVCSLFVSVLTILSCKWTVCLVSSNSAAIVTTNRKSIKSITWLDWFSVAKKMMYVYSDSHNIPIKPTLLGLKIYKSFTTSINMFFFYVYFEKIYMEHISIRHCPIKSSYYSNILKDYKCEDRTLKCEEW